MDALKNLDIFGHIEKIYICNKKCEIYIYIKKCNDAHD